MLGKLIKYEFKATGRVFLPVFSALLIMAAITRLFIGMRLETPKIIAIVLSSMLLAAAFVITLVLTLQRFYKNLMMDEGYLMHTLPVSAGRLIWSKLIVAAVWSIVCGVAAFAALSIMALSTGEAREIFRALTQIGILSYDQVMLAFECFLIFLAALACGILMLYACMALSLFFQKHRVAISFAFYIGVVTVLQMIPLLFSRSLEGVVREFSQYPAGDVQSGLAAFFHNHPVLAVHSTAVLILLGLCALSAGFFAITRSMLKNKLNLQ